MFKFFGLLIAFLTTFSTPASAETRFLKIRGDHGNLATIMQTPEKKESYPMVILMHGFTGHKYDPLISLIADTLLKNGIASVRFDFNGHGESEGAFHDMTLGNEIEDAKKVYEYVRALPQVTSVSMLGHSQGALVTSLLAGEIGEEKIKSIVLLAPPLNVRDDVLNGHLHGAWFNPYNLPERMKIYKGNN